MRLCTNCYHITTGKPLHCNRCGSTYNVRLCRSQHINPRAAKFCATCGSKELSTPQPKVPLLFRPLVFLAGIGPGMLLLLALSIYLCYFAYQIVTDPNGLLPLMCWGLLLGMLFVVWMMLPKFLRQMLKVMASFVFRRRNGKEGRGHGH